MDNKKQFLKKLEGLSRSRSPHQMFSDWLEIAALSIHQLPYHGQELERDATFEKYEQLYLERIKPYNKDELKVFGELLMLTIADHRTGYGDFLGEIAGEADLLNARGGQFFTPYHLCRAIAKMTFGNVKPQVEEKGVLTVCEPAVGAGALVIASAEEVASQGIDPRAHLQFDCTDVSRDAFNMAYVQLSAQGLQAVVRHGNTLTNEYWENRPTPQLRLFEQWLAPQRRAAKLVQIMRSLFEDESPSPVESTPPATSLFDLDEFAAECEKPKRDRRSPDVVLGEQMSLFD